MSTSEETIPGQLDGLRDRIEQVETDVRAVKKTLDENTTITRSTADVVNEIRDYQTAARVVLKAAIWLGGLAGAAVAIWQFIEQFAHRGIK